MKTLTSAWSRGSGRRCQNARGDYTGGLVGGEEVMAHKEYLVARLNKTAMSEFDGLTYDGGRSISTEQQRGMGKKRKDYWYEKYHQGPEDARRMAEQDRNYVFELEAEGQLDQVEPNLETEVPSLYAEIQAYRKAKIETTPPGRIKKLLEPVEANTITIFNLHLHVVNSKEQHLAYFTEVRKQIGPMKEDRFVVPDFVPLSTEEIDQIFQALMQNQSVKTVKFGDIDLSAHAGAIVVLIDRRSDIVLSPPAQTISAVNAILQQRAEEEAAEEAKKEAEIARKRKEEIIALVRKEFRPVQARFDSRLEKQETGAQQLRTQLTRQTQQLERTVDGKLKSFGQTTGKRFKKIESSHQALEKAMRQSLQDSATKQQTSTRAIQQELQRTKITLERQLGEHKKTLGHKLEHQQSELRTELSAPMTFVKEQREYRISNIESAIAQRNIPRLKELLQGLPDLRGINLTEAVEQAVDKESFSTEQQIELRSKGAILSFRNLIEDIDGYLESIETHPENQPILKKLYHLLERYINNWQEGTLQSSTVKEGFDQAATATLRQRYDVSELRGSITQVLNQELQKDKETNQKLWLLDQVPAAIKELFDEKMEGHYLHRLRDWIPENIPGYDQMQTNIQRAFYERYKENKLEESYAQEMDNTVAMEVLEKLTSQNPNIKPLTPEFGQALVAEATKVEATDEFRGKIYTDKTPIYRAAITNLLKKWRDENLEQETTQKVYTEFEGMIESRLAAIRLENPLRESLEREGINILIAQVKIGYQVRQGGHQYQELPDELLDILLENTSQAIGSVKPKPEEITQSLRKLLTIKREDPERLTEEDHAHIDNITQERWSLYLTKLRPYVYPSLMQGQVQKLETESRQLRTENQELKAQLAQTQTMVLQLSSQFAQFAGRQETDATEEQPDPTAQARSRVGMFGKG
jgi:hypothetical protein